MAGRRRGRSGAWAWPGSSEMLIQGIRQGSKTLWSSIQMVDYGSVLDVKEFAQNQKRLGTDVLFF